MKKMLFVLAIFTLAVGSCDGIGRTGNTPPLELTLSTDKDGYRPDEEVVVYVTLKNIGERNLLVNS